jgi:hypothetical protein
MIADDIRRCECLHRRGRGVALGPDLREHTRICTVSSREFEFIRGDAGTYHLDRVRPRPTAVSLHKPPGLTGIVRSDSSVRPANQANPAVHRIEGGDDFGTCRHSSRERPAPKLGKERGTASR